MDRAQPDVGSLLLIKPVDSGAQSACLSRTVFMLRTLANATRLTILNYLIAGECSVAQIEDALHIGQPVLSQQLAELRQAGALVARRKGKSVFYRLQAGAMTKLVELLCAVTEGSESVGVVVSTRHDMPSASGAQYE